MGTELLLGQIVNSNATAIGRRLAEEGFDTHFQTVVGDNLVRLVAALRMAADRADAVVITGGIGPTQDDLTREALCELTGAPMTRDEAHAIWIDHRLRAQGREPSPTVMRMADLPEGSEGLNNISGVALGVALHHEGKWLFAMPGVPAEMTSMLDLEVLPRLQLAAGEQAVLRSRVLHCWGLGESSVAAMLDDLFELANPSVAFLIRDMEVSIRITAKAEDEETALGLIDPVQRNVMDRLGEVVFSSDAMTVEQLIVEALVRFGWTVSTVERATLGQVAARLAAADADDSVFAGGVVAGRGESAAATADVVLDVGAIGPDRSNDRRTTRVVEMTVKTPLGVQRREFEFGGDDERVRSFATIAGLHLLRLGLERTS